MNENNLESLIRSLRPSPLPPEFIERLSISPRPARRLWLALSLATIPAAAACLLLWGRPNANPPGPETPPSSLHQVQSTLLASQPVSILREEGRTWEIVEQIWQDQGIATAASTPEIVTLCSTRHEIVCLPVRFD